MKSDSEVDSFKTLPEEHPESGSPAVVAPAPAPVPPAVGLPAGVVEQTEDDATLAITVAPGFWPCEVKAEPEKKRGAGRPKKSAGVRKAMSGRVYRKRTVAGGRSSSGSAAGSCSTGEDMCSYV
jgi:hypothetical protein